MLNEHYLLLVLTSLKSIPSYWMVAFFICLFTCKVWFVKYKHNCFGFFKVLIFMTYLVLPIPFRSMCAGKAAVGGSEAGILGSSSGLLLLWSGCVFIFNPFSWSVFQMSKAICLAGLLSIFFVCSLSCGSSSWGFAGLFIHRVGFSSFSLSHVCSTCMLYFGVFPSLHF